MRFARSLPASALGADRGWFMQLPGQGKEGPDHPRNCGGCGVRTIPRLAPTAVIAGCSVSVLGGLLKVEHQDFERGRRCIGAEGRPSDDEARAPEASAAIWKSVPERLTQSK